MSDSPVVCQSSALCQNAMVMCRVRGEMCDHTKNMASCPTSKFESIVYPTFEQCMRIYDEKSADEPRTKIGVLINVKNALGILGVSLDSRVDVLSYEMFEQLRDKLRDKNWAAEYWKENPKRKSKIDVVYSDDTIASIFTAFRTIVSDKYRTEFRERGFCRYVFDIPKMTIKKHPKKGMTPKQRVKVDQYMWRLREAKNVYDAEKFKALFFSRKLGMRPSDINRLKWTDISNETGKWIVTYTPGKTKKKTGVEIKAILSDELAQIILVFRPDNPGPQDYVLQRFTRGNHKHVKSGTYRNLHESLWRELNKQYSEWGICDRSKKFYLNRRECGTEAFKHGGTEEACGLLGNSPAVFSRNYYIRKPVEVA